MHWPLYSTNMVCRDIFAAAKRANLTAAAVYWPITGCNPNIDHIYFFYNPGGSDRVEEIFAEQGADKAPLQAVKENLYLFLC